MRVVFDTNVFVSALVIPGSTSDESASRAPHVPVFRSRVPERRERRSKVRTPRPPHPATAGVHSFPSTDSALETFSPPAGSTSSSVTVPSFTTMA